MRFIIVSALLALHCLFVSAFAADTFHDQFSATIPGGNTSCAQAAQNLALLFASAAPAATNIVGKCELDTSFTEAKQTYHSFTISIAYDASAPVSIFKVNFQADPIWDTAPMFTSYANCLNARANQMSIFMRATGLNPLTVGCELSADSISTNYTMSIAAVGKSKTSLFQMADLSMTQMPPTGLQDNAWMAGIASDLTAQGAIVAARSGITTFYYATQSLIYSSSILEQFPTSNLCQSQLDQAMKIVAATGAKHPTVACHKTNSLAALAMRGDFSSLMIQSDYGSGSPVFHSVAECMQARDEVLGKNAAVGGFCVTSSNNDNFYQVESFRISL